MDGSTDTTANEGPRSAAPDLGLPDALARDALKSMLFGLAPAPKRIGRYRIVGVLGEGGMGLVFHAHDDELSRPVALKVLHEGEGEGSPGRTRLLREAQAMAQLSHPNVVQVHDVGEHEGQVFLAMELIRGQTLRSWVAALGDPVTRSRRWKEAVAMFVQAARGLAAAHAVGLVHRDFKPANALVGEDGRVRVLDFGLARGRVVGSGGGASLELDDEGVEPVDAAHSWSASASASAIGSASIPALLSETMTVDGTVLGTPAYISPEQLAGERADAASDQFSFCVALYEALHGVRPFGGKTLLELDEAMRAGTRVESPPGVVVPGWLDAAIVRGLAFVPGERWASMDALVEALLDDPAARRRRRLLATGAVAVLGTVAAGAWVHEQREQARCEASGEAVFEDWSEEPSQAVHAAFAATELELAEGTWERVTPRLDAWAQEWSGARMQACLDARDGREEHRLREVCLDRERWQLTSTLDVLREADRGVVMRAVSMVSELPRASACEEPGALAAAAASASSEASREQLERVRRSLVEVVVDERAGRIVQAIERAEQAKTEAEALGDESLRAEVLLRLGAVLGERGDQVEAEEALRGSFFTAGGIGYDPVAMQAAVALMDTVGKRLARPREGHDWAAHARMAMRRMGREPADADASFFERLGNIHYAEGDYQAAGEAYERAIARYEQAGDAEHPAIVSALSNLGTVHRVLGEPERARELYERGLVLTERTLGEAHPEAALLLDNLGSLELVAGRPAEAIAWYRRALAIQEATLGPSSSKVAATLGLLGSALRSQGDLEGARRAHRRAVEVAVASLGPDHPETAQYHTNLGFTLKELGELDEALAEQERALAIREQAQGPMHPSLVSAVLGVGNVLELLGRNDDALAHYHRALEIEEKALGPDHPDLATTLDDYGVGLREVGRLDEALAAHQRALALREAAFDPGHPDFAASHDCIGEVLERQGQAAAAVESHRRALVIREATRGPRHPRTAKTLRLLGEALLASGAPEQALPLLERARSIMDAPGVGDPSGLASVLTALGRARLATEDGQAAAQLLRRALVIREAGPDAPRLIAETRFALARASWEVRAERESALALARQAREEYAASGPLGEAAQGEVTAWLAARGEVP